MERALAMVLAKMWKYLDLLANSRGGGSGGGETSKPGNET